MLIMFYKFLLPSFSTRMLLYDHTINISSDIFLGESLAKAEIPLLVAKLFQRFKFESATGEKIDLKGNEFFALLEPEPFKVKVQKRC